MTLFLAGSWQQGLLALVVNVGAPSAAANGQNLSGVAIQNAMYYLKARGIPMRYKFDYSRYGAICQDIVTDLEWLAADEVIKDQSTNPGKNRHYTPGTAINEILEFVSDLTPEERKIITDTTTELTRLSPNELEILAGLDYLLRDVRATGQKERVKETVIERFIQVKRDKFTEEEIEPIYDIVARLVAPQPQ
jgi:hypothetical protein